MADLTTFPSSCSFKLQFKSQPFRSPFQSRSKFVLVCRSRDGASGSSIPRRTAREKRIHQSNVNEGTSLALLANNKLQKQLEHEKSSKLLPGLSQERSFSTHKLLRVISGKVGGKKLLSPTDMHVRPMMEVVRGAVFNMLQALGGSSVGLSGCWLDLYSGTGSVGIEALSRGCETAHFVENDPWIISNVLTPNLKSTRFYDQAVIHAARVEAYLQRASVRDGKSGIFDYVSVTPPYESVDYPSLLESLSRSSLIGKNTCVVVEYPLECKHEMTEICGMLQKIQDRRYGRTHVAIYGPKWAQT